VNTTRPARTIRAIVKTAAQDNWSENRSRLPLAELVTLTATDIVERYGLDAGTYEHSARGADVSAAEQLVRHEMLVAYRAGDLVRLRRADGSPSRRGRQYEYIAADTPRVSSHRTIAA
jgi:hypothetical protein